jgi:hypothetical protein
MLKRTLLTALAAAAALAFAASAQAAYLSLGTTNTSNTTTALSGNAAGSELLVKNTNGSSASAFGLYALLTATAPTVTATAVRGQNSATNGRGYGVYGSQAGSGTGVRGFAPSGKGVWGSSTSGIGVLAQHTGTTGTNPALSASTNSTAANSAAIKATTNGPGVGIYGLDLSTGSSGVGVFGYHNGSGTGVQGMAVNGRGVAGFSGSWQGVYGHSNSNAGVVGESDDFDGVYGVSHKSSTAGVSGHNAEGGYAVWGGAAGGTGVYGTGAVGVRADGTGYGVDASGGVLGIRGESLNGTAVDAATNSGDAVYAYSDNFNYPNSHAGYFNGNVLITGTCTGCAGPSALQIDDPLDPARKYLNHASVVSSQQLDVYSGNVTTNGKGFATVRMPRWFQALNRSFRYQLTPVGHRAWGAPAIVWNPMKRNRFTIRSKPGVEISWQVTAVRHDRFAEAHATQVIAGKSKADQGKYVNPELYGKPRSDGLGYQKPPRLPQRSAAQR